MGGRRVPAGFERDTGMEFASVKEEAVDVALCVQEEAPELHGACWGPVPDPTAGLCSGPRPLPAEEGGPPGSGPERLRPLREKRQRPRSPRPPRGPEKLYPCPDCPRRYTTLWNLKRHWQAHSWGAVVEKLSAGGRPCPCPRCRPGCPGPDPPPAPRPLPGPGPRPYGCPQCRRAFGSSRALKCHLRAHRVPKGRDSHPRPRPEQSHRRGTPAGAGGREGPGAAGRGHACVACGRAFGSSASLRRHRLLHTGERPFACALCPRRFRQAPHLKAHARTHAAGARHSATAGLTGGGLVYEIEVVL